MSSSHSTLIPRISSFLSQSQASAAAGDDLATVAPKLVSILLVALSAVIYYFILRNPSTLKPHRKSNAKVVRSLIGRLGEMSYYNRRKQWMDKHIGAHIKSGNDVAPVRISVANKILTIVSGSNMAKGYFNNRDLAFTAAYQELFAGVERPMDKTSDDGLVETDDHKVNFEGPMPIDMNQRSQWSMKHFRVCLSNGRLAEHDVMRKIAMDYKLGIQRDILDKDGIDGSDPASKGQGGFIVPHDHIYFMMFQVSIRVMGANEMVQDRALIKPLLKSYWDQENNSNFFNTFMRWLPLKSNRLRKEGGKDLFMGLYKVLQKRIDEGREEQDYIQNMLNVNIPAADIATWQIGALFASIINTSAMASWTLVFASADRRIWEKLRREVDGDIARLTAARGLSASAPLHEKIASITIEELEENFNYAYWCLRETMRLAFGDVLLRKVDNKKSDGANVSTEFARNGEYIGFYTGSVHMSEDIYSDPSKYWPDRWELGQGLGPNEFLGWGTGLHPCLGMKLAKNEIKQLLAFMVSMFDLQPVDNNGNVYNPDTVPRPPAVGSSYRAANKPLKLKYTMRGNA